MDLLTVLLLAIFVLFIFGMHQWGEARSYYGQVSELTRRLVEAHEELDGFRNRERAAYRSTVLEWPTIVDERQGELPV